jgi:hypothetical protein
LKCDKRDGPTRCAEDSDRNSTQKHVEDGVAERNLCARHECNNQWDGTLRDRAKCTRSKANRKNSLAMNHDGYKTGQKTS